MKDMISEYIMALCEIFAGMGIIYLFLKFAPVFMSTIN